MWFYRRFGKLFRKKTKGISFHRNDVFIRNLVLLLGAVSLRRGVWNLLDYYLFPDDLLVSNWVSIGIGVFLIFILDDQIKHEVRTAREGGSYEED